MVAKTYSLQELLDLNQDYKRLDDKKIYEGLEIKQGEGKGIHYWMGFPSLMSFPGDKHPVKEDDYRYIAIIDSNVTVERQRWGEFFDEATGYEKSEQYTAVKTPVQGLIELQVNPYNRSEVWLKYVEVHSDFRGKGLLAPLLEELVVEMKRTGLKLVRSSVSESAPKWLKPKMDKLLDDAGIAWSQNK